MRLQCKPLPLSGIVNDGFTDMEGGTLNSQPCNPRMVSARDAIIEADIALTGGENLCEIWSGFAKRGLGVGAVAADVRVDNFDMPDDVC